MGRSQRELKNRIKSVESTMHITRAMELVSSSKFKKAVDSFEKGRCYFEMLNETFAELSDYVKDSPFFKESCGNKKTYIVIAGDRGLVGGFNNSLYKIVDNMENGEKQTEIIPVGKKAHDHYKKDSRVCIKEGLEISDKVSSEQIRKFAEELSKQFIKGETDEIYVVYTRYLTMLNQEASIMKLLPIVPEKREHESLQMIFEPSADGVLMSAVPEYISGLLYGALQESIVSENAARRMAMDSATKNAGEIIDTLTLEYNRARQSAITQEITEIVAGAEK